MAKTTKEKKTVTIETANLFLNEDFRNYAKDLTTDDTAKWYVEYYLPSLFNQMPFQSEEPRKWILWLDGIFAYNLNLGFIVLDFWLSELNKYIIALKAISPSRAKTFKNKRSALQAYIAFLNSHRSLIQQKISTTIPINKKYANSIKRLNGSITITQYDLIMLFLARMKTEDRFPTQPGAVYYPARLINKVLGKRFETIAKQCIREIIVYTTSGNYKLRDIDEFIIKRNRVTLAKIKEEEYAVTNEDTWDFLKQQITLLIANSSADLSREHAPSISTILEDTTRTWKALDKLTNIIKQMYPNPKQKDAHAITQDVWKNQQSNIQKLSNDLEEDLKTILKETKFTLMQRSLNSSLNKHP